MANSILPKATTFTQWVKHPMTATVLFAFSLSTTLLFLNVQGNNSRVKDCQAERNLWKAAYDTMLKLKVNADEQVFLERYYNSELTRKVDSLVQNKLQDKIGQ